MMFLLGRHAMFGHEPPTYLRSITATRCPSLAKVQAATVPPVPPPRITKSYSSTLSFCLEGAFCVVLMPCSFGTIHIHTSNSHFRRREIFALPARPSNTVAILAATTAVAH